MALPRQVEAQLKEIEAIEKQLQAPAEPAPAAVEPAPAAQQNETAPTTAAESAPTTAVAEPAPAPAEDPKWEQRYKTLKGMYDAEVPRLHAQVKELTAAIAQLQAQQAPAAPAPAPATQKLVTDEDVQAFGEDLIEVQRKVAREVAAEFRTEIDALKAQNAQLQQQLGQTGQQVAETSFDQRLHRLVPDFSALNDDPRWIAWLDEVDPMLRGPRRIAAQEALNRGDAEGVAHYVDLFRQSIAPAAQPAPAADKAAELERQIQPRRAAGNGAPAPQGKLYTAANISEMFGRAARLSASGQIDEARKLEAEIDAAYMEGRVTA